MYSFGQDLLLVNPSQHNLIMAQYDIICVCVCVCSLSNVWALLSMELWMDSQKLSWVW